MNKWTDEKPMMSIARANAACAVWKDRLYIIGGTNYNCCLESVEYYCVIKGIWTTDTPMPHAISNPQAGVTNGYLFVVGSFNGFQTIQRYNPIYNIWVEASSFLK